MAALEVNGCEVRRRIAECIFAQGLRVAFQWIGQVERPHRKAFRADDLYLIEWQCVGAGVVISEDGVAHFLLGEGFDGLKLEQVGRYIVVQRAQAQHVLAVVVQIVRRGIEQPVGDRTVEHVQACCLRVAVQRLCGGGGWLRLRHSGRDVVQTLGFDRGELGGDEGPGHVIEKMTLRFDQPHGQGERAH